MRGIFDNLNTNLIIKHLSTVQCTALTFWHGFYRYPEERKYEWMNETQNYKLSDQNDDKMKSEKSESGSQMQKLDKQVTSSVSSSSSSSVLVWCYARVPVSCISAFCFNTSVLRLQHLQSLQLRISHLTHTGLCSSAAVFAPSLYVCSSDSQVEVCGVHQLQ